MTELSRGDAEQLLHFVADVEAIDDDQPFTGELLVELGRLVEADWVSYCELDRVRRRSLLLVDRTGDADDGNVDEDIFWKIVVEEHPVCVQHQRGFFRALKVSDFLTPTQLHESRLYDLWFRPYSVEHELSVPIPSPLWHTKTFLFDRMGKRDFTERDRLVLDLLQPRLAAIWDAARTRRLLRAALAELEVSDATASRGVVFLNPVGDIEFASDPARRLLEEYFGTAGAAMLPPDLAEWVASGTGPLVRRQAFRELTVERADETLILQERQREVELTAREREVLAWVARGKTNPEIAELLWLAPSTVRKHLENVYTKLGVRTRTAAAARFFGVSDAEES